MQIIWKCEILFKLGLLDKNVYALTYYYIKRLEKITQSHMINLNLCLLHYQPQWINQNNIIHLQTQLRGIAPCITTAPKIWINEDMEIRRLCVFWCKYRTHHYWLTDWLTVKVVHSLRTSTHYQSVTWQKHIYADIIASKLFVYCSVL